MPTYRSALFSILLVLSLCAGCVSDAPSAAPDRDAGAGPTDDDDGGTTSKGDAGSDPDTAACETTCTPSCIDNIEVSCEEVGNGCFKEITAACGEGSACDAELGTCSAGCSACQEGTLRCNSDGDGPTIQECVVDEQGCTSFESFPCTGGRCVDDGDVPRCTVDECTLDEGQCMNRDFYRCAENGQDRSWEYQFEATCGFLERCDAASGCVCRNPCVQGEQSCFGSTPRVCVTDPDTGCTTWSNDHPCRNTAERRALSCITPMLAEVCVSNSLCFLVEEVQCVACVMDGSEVKCG